MSWDEQSTKMTADELAAELFENDIVEAEDRRMNWEHPDSNPEIVAEELAFQTEIDDTLSEYDKIKVMLHIMSERALIEATNRRIQAGDMSFI